MWGLYGINFRRPTASRGCLKTLAGKPLKFPFSVQIRVRDKAAFTESQDRPKFQQYSCLDGRFALTNFRLIYTSRSVSRRHWLVNFLGRYRLHIGRRLCRMDFGMCGVLQGHSERKTVLECDVQRRTFQSRFCDRRWRRVFGWISPE